MTPSEIDTDLVRKGFQCVNPIGGDEGRRELGYFFGHPQGWRLEAAQ